jgi:hypothetical protein
VAPNSHIVRRVEESGIDARSVTDDSLQEFGIAAVAASHPMLAENPDVAGPRFGCFRNRRNDLIIRIDSRRHNHIDLAGREPGQSRIDHIVHHLGLALGGRPAAECLAAAAFTQR